MRPRRRGVSFGRRGFHGALTTPKNNSAIHGSAGMASEAAHDHWRFSFGGAGFFCVAMALVFFTLGCGVEDPSIVQEYIEGEFVYLASPSGGRLERLSVRRGDYVETGAPLFALEERRLSGLRGRRLGGAWIRPRRNWRMRSMGFEDLEGANFGRSPSSRSLFSSSA